MAIYALGDRVPKIHETAFVHPEAVIIGAVEIGAESTIWAGAVYVGTTVKFELVRERVSKITVSFIRRLRHQQLSVMIA